MHCVFTYGTLSIPSIMEALTGKCFSRNQAHVSNYERFLLRDKPYPGICRRPGVSTSGVLYGGIDDDSLRVLDMFEDNVYVRETIEVTTECGESLQAWTYLIPFKSEYLLGTELWNQNHFLALHGDVYMEICACLRQDDVFK